MTFERKRVKEIDGSASDGKASLKNSTFKDVKPGDGIFSRNDV